MEDMKLILTENLESKLHSFPRVTSSANEVAEAIKARAIDLAPVETGRYRDGIEMQPASEKTRGVARVYASDQKSSWVEYGTATHPAQFVFRRAAESLGLVFKRKGA